MKTYVLSRHFNDDNQVEVSQDGYFPKNFVDQNFLLDLVYANVFLIRHNEFNGGFLFHCFETQSSLFHCFESFFLFEQSLNRIAKKIILHIANNLQHDDTITDELSELIKNAIINNLQCFYVPGKLDSNDFRFTMYRHAKLELFNSITEILFHNATTQLVENLSCQLKKSRLPNLRHLDMFSITSDILSPEIVTDFVASLRFAKNLQSLVLSIVSDEMLLELSKLVANYSSLKSLSVYRSVILAEGTEQVFLQSLRANNSIETLKLSIGTLTINDSDVQRFCLLRKLELIGFNYNDIKKIIQQTNSITHLVCRVNVDVQMRNALQNNISILSFVEKTADGICNVINTENHLMLWSHINKFLIGFCLALAPLQLPPYVLLEIFDHLPRVGSSKSTHIRENYSIMYKVDHRKKIDRIYSVLSSIRKINKGYICFDD